MSSVPTSESLPGSAEDIPPACDLANLNDEQRALFAPSATPGEGGTATKPLMTLEECIDVGRKLLNHQPLIVYECRLKREFHARAIVEFNKQNPASAAGSTPQPINVDTTVIDAATGAHLPRSVQWSMYCGSIGMYENQLSIKLSMAQAHIPGVLHYHAPDEIVQFPHPEWEYRYAVEATVYMNEWFQEKLRIEIGKAATAATTIATRESSPAADLVPLLVNADETIKRLQHEIQTLRVQTPPVIPPAPVESHDAAMRLLKTQLLLAQSEATHFKSAYEQLLQTTTTTVAAPANESASLVHELQTKLTRTEMELIHANAELARTLQGQARQQATPANTATLAALNARNAQLQAELELALNPQETTAISDAGAAIASPISTLPSITSYWVEAYSKNLDPTVDYALLPVDFMKPPTWVSALNNIPLTLELLDSKHRRNPSQTAFQLFCKTILETSMWQSVQNFDIGMPMMCLAYTLYRLAHKQADYNATLLQIEKDLGVEMTGDFFENNVVTRRGRGFGYRGNRGRGRGTYTRGGHTQGGAPGGSQ
jgi:hypothetical protein